MVLVLTNLFLSYWYDSSGESRDEKPCLPLLRRKPYRKVTEVFFFTNIKRKIFFLKFQKCHTYEPVLH